MRLPPRAGLGAFEAAARHLSLTRATDELHVTQTRDQPPDQDARGAARLPPVPSLPRQLLLIEERQRLLPPVRDAFDGIAEPALDQAAGRLIRPFGICIPFPLASWLVCLEGRADRPRIRAFREWTLSEGALQGDACE